MQPADNKETEIVAAVGRQLEKTDIRQSVLFKSSCAYHLIIMARCKTKEDREFCIRLCIKEQYSKRELDGQIDSGIFERVMIGNQKLSPMLREIYLNNINSFKDSYAFEFLNPGYFTRPGLLITKFSQLLFVFRPALGCLSCRGEVI